ncbi:MAG: serine hydrolase domain-containing protein [Acidimicrobiales bacterium]
MSDPTVTARSWWRRVPLVVVALVAAACAAGEGTGGDAATVGQVAAVGADDGENADPPGRETVDETASTSEAAAASTVPAAADAGDDPEGESPDGEHADDPEAAIGAAVEAWMLEGGVPGAAVAVVLADDEVIEVARGVADLRSGQPLSSEDYFRTGSTTKPLTAAVVLQLAEEGRLALDEPVTSYLGEGWSLGYEYEPELTVRNLLDHTSGYAEFAADPGFFGAASERLDRAFEPAEILAWAADRGPVAPVGSEYSYTTVGHVAIGLVIESVTGNAAAGVMRDRLFDPVGAGDIYLTPLFSPPEPVVTGYVGGEVKAQLSLLAGFAEYTDAAAVDGYYDVSVVPQQALRSAGWTGGGLESQVDDLAIVFASLFDGTALSADSVTEMLTTTVDETYGLSVGLSRVGEHEVYSHGGGVPGFRSIVAYVPELDVAVAISANLVPIVPDIDELLADIVALLTG